MSTIVFVNVLNFPGGLLQPVQADHKHDQCYKILEESDDPEHDYWEFTKDDIVKCEKADFSESEFGLIAKSICKCDIETR